MMKIDKDIPIPKTSGLGSPRKYPFGEMEVGDSFFIEVQDSKRLNPAFSYYGKRHNMKFTCRKQEGGYRVWRVK